MKFEGQFNLLSWYTAHHGCRAVHAAPQDLQTRLIQRGGGGGKNWGEEEGSDWLLVKTGNYDTKCQHMPIFSPLFQSKFTDTVNLNLRVKQVALWFVFGRSRLQNSALSSAITIEACGSFSALSQNCEIDYLLRRVRQSVSLFAWNYSAATRQILTKFDI
jgi:hypothetical protein